MQPNTSSVTHSMQEMASFVTATLNSHQCFRPQHYFPLTFLNEDKYHSFLSLGGLALWRCAASSLCCCADRGCWHWCMGGSPLWPQWCTVRSARNGSVPSAARLSVINKNWTFFPKVKKVIHVEVLKSLCCLCSQNVNILWCCIFDSIIHMAHHSAMIKTRELQHFLIKGEEPKHAYCNFFLAGLRRLWIFVLWFHVLSSFFFLMLIYHLIPVFHPTEKKCSHLFSGLKSELILTKPTLHRSVRHNSWTSLVALPGPVSDSSDPARDLSRHVVLLWSASMLGVGLRTLFSAQRWPWQQHWEVEMPPNCLWMGMVSILPSKAWHAYSRQCPGGVGASRLKLFCRHRVGMQEGGQLRLEALHEVGISYNQLLVSL